MNKANLLSQKLFVTSPFKEFVPEDDQNFTTSIYVFRYLIKQIKPEIIIEVGSWKGHSAIAMAVALNNNKLTNSKIICVDTWLGSIEHWRNDKYKSELNLRYGYPTLYEKFLGNVVRSGYEDYILPIPMPSSMAADFLQGEEIKADLIYIDAAHDYDSVTQDLNKFYPLLSSKGVIFGDDYSFEPTRKAAQDFAANNGLILLSKTGKYVLAKTTQVENLTQRADFFTITKEATKLSTLSS